MNTKQRNKEIIKLKDLNKSQQFIAKKFGVTRQRIQQIEKTLGLDRKKKNTIYNHICKECKNIFLSNNKNRKYCNRKCSSLGRIKYKTAEEIEEHRLQVMEEKRIRSRNYYNNKKLDK